MDSQDYGDKLFEIVQTSQGYAYIADLMTGYSKEQVLILAKDCLKWTLKTVEQLQSFIAELEGKE